MAYQISVLEQSPEYHENQDLDVYENGSIALENI